MTCMYYSSTNLFGVTPSPTLYNDIKNISKMAEEIDDSRIFSN